MPSGFRSAGKPDRARGVRRSRRPEWCGAISLDRDAVESGFFLVGKKGELLQAPRLVSSISITPGSPPQAIGDVAGRGDQFGIASSRAVRRSRPRSTDKNRRARRQLDDFDPRLVLLGNLRERVMKPQCKGVALGLSVFLAHEVDPDLGLMRHLAQVVVAYQAVEVDRAGEARRSW